MKLDKNGNIKQPKIEPKLPDFTPPQPEQGNEYGINVPQLEMGIQVGGSSGGGGSPVVGFEVLPTTTTIGNVDITSTAIGFTPSCVRIQAQLDASSGSGSASWSDMTYDGTRSGGIFTLGSQADYSFTRMFRLFDSSSNQIGADPVELVQGGVRVNVTTVSLAEPVNIIITAYP